MYQYVAIILTIILLLSPMLARKYRRWRDTRILRSLKHDDRKLLQLFNLGNLENFKNHVENIKFDPNFRDPITKRTLLMMCAPEDKRLEFAKYLLEKGCDINAVDQKGMDMLFLTSYWNCNQLFEWVLQQKDLILDRSNSALGFELNPLTSCIFKAHDLTKHMATQKELSGNTNFGPNDRVLLRSSCDKWYAKAIKLLQKGADPGLCRKIIMKAPAHNKIDNYYQFEPLLDFFERWHASKKILLMDYYLAKQGKEIHPVEGKKFFDVKKLPPTIINKLADEFL